MKRRILTIILAIAMVFASVPVSVVFANGSKANYTVTANKTTAVAGDEMEFSVKLDLINRMTAFEFTLDIPSGLTLIPGSQTAISSAQLGFDTINNNESALLVSGYGHIPYTATGTLTLATFKCTVDSNAVGKYTVGLKDTVLNDDEYEEEAHDVTSVEINVAIPATGISIKETTTLTEGNTEQLTAILTPTNATDTVSWTSNDDSVATVSSTGLVTAVKKGTATITATAGNASATCVVTVECSHTNTTVHPAESSTCLKQGHAEYYTCDACGEVISGSAELLPLGNHTGGTATCKDKAICDVCHQPYGGYGAHSLTQHDRNEPDHYNTGNIQYWTCDVCNKYFSDYEGKNEIEEKDTVLEIVPHSYPETWVKDGTQHWKECGCGNKIEVADHSYDNACDTTCNVCGYVRSITHSYQQTWSTDEENHWHECSVCHDKKDVGTHSGGTATCKAKAVCKTCNTSYGDFGEHNYIEKIDAKYLKSAATCKDLAVYYKSCSVCGEKGVETFTTGTVDKTNHAGGTHLVGQKEASCFEEGYTGDTYCSGCDTKLQSGQVIGKTGHNPASVWSTDAEYHWKECQTVGCGNKIDKAAHSGGEATCISKAVCEICHVEYGEINPNNHKNTTVINATPATCYEEGYTGDTYCNDCKKVVANGTAIQKTSHTASDWKFDEDEHWKVCTVEKCGVEMVESRAKHTESDWIIDKPATFTEEGSKHIECTVCGKVIKTKSIAKLIAYEIIDGTDGAKCTWTKESKNDLLFTSNAEFSKFVEVKIDGKVIDTNNYYAKAGSTEITLKNSYLETLSDGKHTLTIVSTDGYAETAFEIKEAEKPVTPVSPQTGDNSNLILWISLLIVSLGGLVTLSVPSKKRKVR